MILKSAQLHLAFLAAGVALGLVPFAGRGDETNRASVAPANAGPLVVKARLAALAMQRQSWEQGVLAVAFLEEGDDEMVIQMAKASLIYQSKDGVPAASGGAPADPLMAGEAIWRAARMTGDPTLGKAVTNMLDYRAQTRASRRRRHPFSHWPNDLVGQFSHFAALSRRAPDVTTKPFSRLKAIANGCGIPKKNCCRTSGMRKSSSFRTRHFGEADKAGLRQV